MGKWSELANKTYKDLQRRKKLKEIGRREADNFGAENHYRIQKYLNRTPKRLRG